MKNHLLTPSMTLAIAITALLRVDAVHGDTIFLTNGNQLAGKIEDLDADPVVLEISGGKITFDRSEIRQLQRDNNGYKGSDEMKAKEGAAKPSAKEDKGPSIADLPPPTTDVERAKRYDLVMTALNKITMNPEEATQEEHNRTEDFIKALGQLGPEIAPKLESSFKHGDVREAGAMLGALRIADPVRAEELAKEALNHLHPEAREQAIEIIAASDSKDKAELLTKALGDLSPINRKVALKALAEVKDKGTAGAIAKLVSDNDPDVQTQAITTLQAITGQKLTTPEAWQAWVAHNTAPNPTAGP